MAKVIIPSEGNTRLWLSDTDTSKWANRPGNRWPGSSLSGHRLYAEFDSHGNLVDLTVDGTNGIDVDSQEFDAITSDFLPKGHPAARF